MFVRYKKIKKKKNFFAQIQGAPKASIKKKSWRMADSLSLDRRVWDKKKSNGFLKRKVGYVTIYHI